MVLHPIQSFSPLRELKADQVLALGSVVTEMGDRELHDTNFTDLAVLAHLGTLTDWRPKKVNLKFEAWSYRSEFNMSINVCLMFLFDFSDEGSDFRSDAEAQTESGAVNRRWSGNIWPSDLWSVSLRDQKTEPLQPQVSQIPNVWLSTLLQYNNTYKSSFKNYIKRSDIQYFLSLLWFFQWGYTMISVLF